tara:strand:+ start:162 stop:431 length:270 start_codon:yes stop_codon:yes gene_type:complete
VTKTKSLVLTLGQGFPTKKRKIQMLYILIPIIKILFVLAYFVFGIALIDLSNTTLISEMNSNDWLISMTGGIFVLASLFLIMAMPNIKR